ncbi:MAG: hypothetical protein OQJ97_17180 [Rhodospirillales bacterium]|nr:hypothetical protein [Rhodospirillales bacterium]
MTILSPINPSVYGAFILQQQLERYNVAQLKREQEGIQADYGQQIGSQNREIEAWNTFKTDITGSQDFLSQTVARTGEIRTTINALISHVYEAQLNGITSADTWNTLAQEYDALIRTWNNTANSNGRALNLIGEATVSDYIFETNIYGAKANVSHSDLTTGYYIIDSGGNTWKKETDYGTLLKQFDSSENLTGEYAAIYGGVRLDNRTGSAVTFTVSPDTTASTQYTGTLYTRGLSVLDAWVYEDLETTTGRSYAIADLETALATLDHNLRRFEAALTQAQYSLGQAGISTNALQNTISNLSGQQLLALQEVDNQASIRNSSSLAYINQSQVIRNEYVNMLGAGTNSDFVGALINILG